MSAPAGVTSSTIKTYRRPKTLVRRFVARRTLRSALIFGIVAGLYMISKASAFIQTYPTVVAREKLAEQLGSNAGIEALLGVAHHLETVAGYAAWNFLCLVAAAGAIWALLIATKTLRGEEDSGRWELLLAGQTTARRATINAVIGLGSGLMVVYVSLALALIAVSRIPGAGFSIGASLFFALALIAGAAEFLAVGALASQLMPTRGRAAGLSVVVFGVFYVIRLVADTTNAAWLLNLSPLGWIERLQPMYASQPIWLLPIGGFVCVLSMLAIHLAGKRDLGGSVFADKDSPPPHLRLLGTPFGLAIRLTRASTLSWLVVVGVLSYLYGSLAKSAGQSFSQSATARHVLSRLAQASKAAAALEFLGIVFFLTMILVMFYAASAVGRMREDEAEGYLDNLLVRPVSRARWLWGRISLITISVILAGLISGLATWVGQLSQHIGVSFNTLLLAGLNTMTPVMVVLGIGIFALGAAPRLTSVLAYGAIGWSFLIVMLSSGLSLNHWLLDTSILHHVALSPTVGEDWTSDAILVVIGLALCFIGALRFNSRDLQPE